MLSSVLDPAIVAIGATSPLLSCAYSVTLSAPPPMLPSLVT
jgi:hypothetical protein